MRGPPDLKVEQSRVKIPGYELRRELGRGVYGVVWEARHEKTGHEYAVKVFQRPVVARTELEWLDRADRLPRVVTLHDARLDHDPPFLVMPRMAGSLGEARFAGASTDQVADWLQQIAEGLTSLHETLGICHCDIKPSNVLVDENRHLYLADFGKAAYLGRELGHLGTPGYMAPEQALERELPSLEQGRVWDIYGLGATGHFLLTGQRPRVSDEFCLSLDSMERPEALTAYRRELLERERPLSLDQADPELARLLTGCLELEARLRVPHPDEVRDFLLRRKGRESGSLN